MGPQDHIIFTGCVYTPESTKGDPDVFLVFHWGAEKIVLDICINIVGTRGQNYAVQIIFASRREVVGAPTSDGYGKWSSSTVGFTQFLFSFRGQ